LSFWGTHGTQSLQQIHQRLTALLQDHRFPEFFHQLQATVQQVVPAVEGFVDLKGMGQGIPFPKQGCLLQPVGRTRCPLCSGQVGGRGHEGSS
jgi:hypothetical protein